MGKAQSKRSVDITTDTKKGDAEVTEKMEKIEDTDRREMNGDASLDSQLEEKSNDDAENDKDTATEKSDDVQAGGDSAEPCKSEMANSNKEDGTTSEEISPLTDENAKKSKKEKVKKKWSFRSISFGKKDKQKPLKTEDSPETTEAATTNGVAEEKTSQENEESQNEKDTSHNAAPDDTPLEVHQNGVAIEQEKTEQTEEMSPDVKNTEETAKIINPTEEKTENNSNETAENNTSLETDKTSNIPTKPDADDIKNKPEENGVTDASKKENNIEEVSTENQSTKDEPAVEATAENKNISTVLKIDSVTVNGNVDEIHQNGSENISHQELEDAKAQIEVKSNTDKATAETLEIISSTTTDPPNVQVSKNHINELNEKIENTEVETEDKSEVLENSKIVCDKPIELIENIEGTEVENEIKSEIMSNSNELCYQTDPSNGEEIFSDELNLAVQDSEVENSKYDSSPPPLPISPPPSHVSVFAFTNKEDIANESEIKAQTDSIQSDNIEIESNQAKDSINCSEISSENGKDTESDAFAIKNMDIVQELLQNDIEDCTTDITESKNTEVDVTEVLVQKNSNDHDDIETQQDLETGTETETTQSLLTDEFNEKCKIDEKNHENSIQSESEEMCSNDNDECPKDNIPQSNNLDQSQADEAVTRLITQEEQMHDKTVFDTIDNLVREETKEINAKDHKECAALAEATQDPSITCE